MRIKFQRYKFLVEFEREINFITPPSFIMRSVIGKELRYISCVLKSRKCFECPLKGKCAYSIIFEVPIDKDNQYLSGRSHASPPFVLNIDYDKRDNVRFLTIDITLIGAAYEYAPYFIMAVIGGGERGLFKERVKYKLIKTMCNGAEINPEAPAITEPYFYELNGSFHNTKHITIKFLSPFRYKKGGKYTYDIDFTDVMTAAVRRLNILSGMYGDGEQITYNQKDIKDIRKNLYWKEESRYSARQKTSMLLGGVMGEMCVSGDIDLVMISLLRGAQMFNIGKNASFGLGHIAVMEEA